MFKKTVFDAIHARMAEVGFKKHKSGILTIDLQDGVIGTLGLPTHRAPRHGAVAVDIVVGIRSDKVERLVAELSEDEYTECIPPTICTQIGYIMPDNAYCSYVFHDQGQVDELAVSMRDLVSRHALPFIRGASSLGRLTDLLIANKYGIPFQTEYRIPVCLHLLGDDRRAAEYLQRKLMAISSRTDPASLNYKTFAKNLLKKLELADGVG